MSSTPAKQKIIVIVGPTASGKSDLGIALAKKLNGEIISADSRQVYRGMDIGTGKVPRDFPANFKFLRHLKSSYSISAVTPGPKLNSKSKITNRGYYSSGIRHYLIDVASPKNQFTADDFKKLSQKVIPKILAKKKTPIIVGGTGFYIDVLLEKIQPAEVPPNKKLRKQLDKLDTGYLFKMLRKLDPRRAKTIESKNKRRLMRALEIIIATGKPVPRPILQNKYQVLWLGLNPDNLRYKIKNRLDTRLEQGMIMEVANLRKQGLSWKRLYDFGLEYRQIAEYLRSLKLKAQNNPNKNQNSKFKIQNFKSSEYYQRLLIEIIKYSKRQMTWFKRNKEIKWLKNPKKTSDLLQSFL